MSWLILNWRMVLPTMAAIGLTIALLIAQGDARHWRKQHEGAVARLNVEQARHAVTRASAERCLQVLDAQSAQVAELAKQGRQREGAVAAAKAAGQAGIAAAERQAQQLETSAAAASPSAACAPSAAFNRIKEQL